MGKMLRVEEGSGTYLQAEKLRARYSLVQRTVGDGQKESSSKFLPEKGPFFFHKISIPELLAVGTRKGI